MTVTPAQQFEAFKRIHSTVSYTGWKENIWLEQCRLYERLGWVVIPLAHNKKRPMSGYEWSDSRSYLRTAERMYEYAKTGCNLAVIAGPSKLVLLDFDTLSDPLLDRFREQTMIMATPKGHCIVTSEPYDDPLMLKLHSKYPSFDNPRRDLMYALVPFSQTCTRDKGKGCNCVRHDYRIREWLTTGNGIIPFRMFAESALDG